MLLGTEKDNKDQEMRLCDTSLAKTFDIPIKMKEIMFFFSSFLPQEIICYLK
tara:strand:- start:46 stop:201 length:156 start_codon:yes stop_codon:yes gene_type:complete